MIDPHLRPRFSYTVRRPAVEILSDMEKILGHSAGFCRGTILGKHVHVKVCKNEVHLWSPELHVDVEEHEDGALIRGLFGPSPSVWTFFVAMYAMVTFLGTVGVLYGFTQYVLDEPTTAFWSAPIALALAGVIYLAGLMGQKLGHDQMDYLRAFLDNSIQHDEKIVSNDAVT